MQDDEEGSGATSEEDEQLQDLEEAEDEDAEEE